MDISKFIPVTKEELSLRKWDSLDIIIVTGDAYVDHPSFGSAVIARVLEKEGFKVGIIPQPDWNSPEDFSIFGKPNLFFAVTSGNMDSLVCNRTSLNKPRRGDTYTAGGLSGKRPDRAVIVYSNAIRKIYKNIPIVIGGIEASLRRIAHYDYWSDSVRRSILLDSKADILVYGMGEKPVVEIARRIKNGAGNLSGIESTALMSNILPDNAEELPSYEEVSSDKKIYAKMHQQFVKYFLKRPDYPITQKYQNRYLVHNSPGLPLTTEEIDSIYALPYTRKWHPVYDSQGGVPALESVKFSITSHRGCFGGCSFCAIFFHQGHIIQNRSEGSIIDEIKKIAQDKSFKGYVSDIGGPTANMYGLSCPFHKKGTHCGSNDCLGKEPCPNLNLDHTRYLNLLTKAGKIPGIKKIFVSTGIRYDLFTEKDAPKIVQRLCENHISGQLKVAPEHISPNVLENMKKPDKNLYLKFLKLFDEINKKLGKKQFAIPYFMTSHPGCTEADMIELSKFQKRLGFIPDQIQDFLPTPMTTSTCMYYTELNPETMQKVYVPKTDKQRKAQRDILHFHKKNNLRVNKNNIGKNKNRGVKDN